MWFRRVSRFSSADQPGLLLFLEVPACGSQAHPRGAHIGFCHLPLSPSCIEGSRAGPEGPGSTLSCSWLAALSEAPQEYSARRSRLLLRNVSASPLGRRHDRGVGGRNNGLLAGFKDQGGCRSAGCGLRPKPHSIPPSRTEQDSTAPDLGLSLSPPTYLLCSVAALSRL